jgi:hypothetical protein
MRYTDPRSIIKACEALLIQIINASPHPQITLGCLDAKETFKENSCTIIALITDNRELRIGLFAITYATHP